MSIRYAHTNIIAEDWKRLVNFYQTVFDCSIVRRIGATSGAWLDVGTGVTNAEIEGVHLSLPGMGENGPTLEIFSYTRMEEKPKPKANRKGFGHLAFEVDDVSAVLADVKAHGGAALGEISDYQIPDAGKLTYVYATDPEGNIIEIQNWS